MKPHVIPGLKKRDGTVRRGFTLLPKFQRVGKSWCFGWLWWGAHHVER